MDKENEKDEFDEEACDAMDEDGKAELDLG